MSRRLLLCTVLALSLLPSGPRSAKADSNSPSWQGPETLGQITEPQINEASGLAHSYSESGLLWTNNDSGNAPVLYAVDAQGRHRGSVRIEGATNRDWEDVASYQIDGRAYLIAADVGDNSATYPECVLYVIAEPDPAELSPSHELFAKPERIIRYVYPDGPRDCESLAVDTTERAIYVISKRTKPPVAYRLPLFPENSGAPLRAETVGPVNGIAEPSGLISRMSVPWGKWRAQVCSLDISRDGLRAAVLTYGEVYLYERREGEDWASAFARGGQQLAAHNLPQAEGLCFSPDGQEIYVTTEGLPAPLLRYRLSQETGQSASGATP
ncbi:hypothetical protein AXK11_01835 [Cephaloticoccus primus]|uniref:Uncharacterized protein n=1 Tax=Cephaloticoccus primus TaxID=1548207 RepID=A0A139STV6_9BACT|nr:LpqB family beta-propeller domain-containing protein [Cephaloticoccus primus]KXU37912.1 hypothetical protein AXK11_01835 [Cephaloticoccus primus]